MKKGTRVSNPGTVVCTPESIKAAVDMHVHQLTGDIHHSFMLDLYVWQQSLEKWEADGKSEPMPPMAPKLWAVILAHSMTIPQGSNIMSN